MLDSLDGRAESAGETRTRVEAGWIFLRLEWQHLDAPMELRRRLQATLARADMQKRPRPA